MTDSAWINERIKPKRRKFRLTDHLGLMLGLAALAMIVVACIVGQGASKVGAIESAQKQGFTDVEVTGEHRIAAGLFGCGEDDLAAFDMTGTNPQGMRVEFTVCSGIFKKDTIRY